MQNRTLDRQELIKSHSHTTNGTVTQIQRLVSVKLRNAFRIVTSRCPAQIPPSDRTERDSPADTEVEDKSKTATKVGDRRRDEHSKQKANTKRSR